jgi:hypothetical protein
MEQTDQCGGHGTGRSLQWTWYNLIIAWVSSSLDYCNIYGAGQSIAHVTVQQVTESSSTSSCF